MAADVGLVADAAKRDTRELPAERACDRLAERGLADTRRSDQRDDRTRSTATQNFHAALLAQLANCKELDDSLLDVAQAGVVLVQDSPRLFQVVVVVRPHVPREVEHPVEVGADPAVLGVLLARPLQAVELSVDLGQHVLGHAGLGDALAVGRHDIRGALVELLLDCLELLPEQELALGLLHAFADVVADLLLERSIREDLLGPADELGQALLEVEGFEDLELLLHRQIGRVPGQVGEVARSLGCAKELDDLRDAPRLDEVFEHGAVFPAELNRLLRGLAVGSGVGLDPKGPADVGLAAAQVGAVLAPDDEGLGAGGKLCGLTQAGDGADLAKLPIDAGHQQDEAVALAGSLDRGLLAVAVDSECDRHVGEDDHIVHGKDW